MQANTQQTAIASSSASQSPCCVLCMLLQALGNEGAAVMVSDVDDSAAQQAVNSLKQQGIKAEYAHCDVSKKNQVQQLIQQTVQQLGGIDILVANAGGLLLLFLVLCCTACAELGWAKLTWHDRVQTKDFKAVLAS
jgi:NAD(P)-dependent dehydrogenase (short-subunit alcohol dehydrogenase family)